MEISSLLTIMKRWWWVLLLAAVLAGAAGYLSSQAAPQTYESRVRMLVGPLNGDNDQLRAAALLTRTYAEVVTGDEVILSAITELGLPHTPEQLRAAIRPTADGATRVLIIRVRDLDQTRAQVIADHLGSRLAELAGDGTADSAGLLSVVDDAQIGVPIGLEAEFIITLSVLAGLLGSLTFVLLVEYFSQTVRDENELISLTDLDYLGSVPAVNRNTAFLPASGFVVQTDPDSPRAAACRVLATKVDLVAADQAVRSLLVVGVGKGHGVGDLTANLAKVLAERRRLTLVDANAVTREISSLLGLADRQGLMDLLDTVERDGGGQLHPAAFTIARDPHLFVVPFGRTTSHHAEHVAPAPWLVGQLLSQADMLVINAASPDRSAATLMWARTVDATLLVVPRDIKRAELLHVTESLRLVGGNPIGVVFEGGRSGRFTTRPVRRQHARGQQASAASWPRELVKVAVDVDPPEPGAAGHPIAADRGAAQPGGRA